MVSPTMASPMSSEISASYKRGRRKLLGQRVKKGGSGGRTNDGGVLRDEERERQSD